MRIDSKTTSLLALLLFVFSMFSIPTIVTTDGNAVSVTNPLRTPNSVGVPADYPDNYTHVEWNQSTVSEVYEETQEWGNWLYGPTVTWSVRNASTDNLIGVQDKVGIGAWADYIVKIPKSSLRGETPWSVAFLGEYVNLTGITEGGKDDDSRIEFLALYFLIDGTWQVYSSTNSTLMTHGEGEDQGSGGGTPPAISAPIELPLEDLFGEQINPYMEINKPASGFVTGPDNLWAQFQLKFNTSATRGVYSIHAAALDSNMMPIAMSRDDEFDVRAVGMTFDEVMITAAGGYYDWERVDDDGNPVYSATRGVDFNMTATITGEDLDNVTVLMDLPHRIRTTRLVDGPYHETVTEYGGWQYDPNGDTYFWNESVVVDRVITRYGLHYEEADTYFENFVEFTYDEPQWDGNQWIFVETTEWAMMKQAIIYWFDNDTFDIRLAYSAYLPTEFIEDPMMMEGGFWEYNEVIEYHPYPEDGSIPEPFILNKTTSGYTTNDSKHIVNFRGHISDKMLPTGGEYWNTLLVQEKVYNTEGKWLIPSAMMPFSSEEQQTEYIALLQLSIETPIAVVQLLHKGEPFDPSWMFVVDKQETFTVKSRLQGGASYASDIDGVAFQLMAYEYDWGYNATSGTDWEQYSDIEAWVKIAPDGTSETIVFNRTERTSWQYGGHWEWQYVEVFSGYYDWEQVWVEDYHWKTEIWDFQADAWTEEWVPYQSPQTIMPVNYLDVGNLTYETIGNDLRVLFDVTPTSQMPDLEWNWEYYFANLTMVKDYESGWGEHTVIGWIQEPVYSYDNGTDHIYAESPYKGITMRNNDTDEKYFLERRPYIVLGGQKEYVKQVKQTDAAGGTYETMIFEEWDPDAYDPMTGEYSGNWVYYYKFLNDTKVPILEGHQAIIYNVTLSNNKTWFLTYNDPEYPRYAWWIPGPDNEYLMALNGTPVFQNMTEWSLATDDTLGTTAGESKGIMIMANGTIPVALATEPVWDYDHYILYLNDSYEEVHVFEEWNWELSEYHDVFYRPSDGKHYWLYDGVWHEQIFEIVFNSTKYLVPERDMQYYAYTDYRGVSDPLPEPGTIVYDRWDLEGKTPAEGWVLIEGEFRQVYFNDEWGYDPVLAYNYPLYHADVGATTYNLTFIGKWVDQPWSHPSNWFYEEFPWVSVANNSYYIPWIEHHDWTVAYGQTDQLTWEFEVEGWFDLVSGYYDGSSGQIYDTNATHTYVKTSTGETMNYTMLERVFFYNITFPNGTYFYAGHPWIEEYINEIDGRYEVEYYFMYDIMGNMVKWYEWTEVVMEAVVAVDYNPILQEFLLVDQFQSTWYSVFTFDYWYYDPGYGWDYWTEDNVYVEQYYAIIATNGTEYEVVPLDWDWEHRYNLPSYNFTYGGVDYNLTANYDMIYKKHQVWGYAMKEDYVPLPISTVRTQYSIIIGAPKWGLWGLQSWTTNPSNGAIDLDGNLDTTDDQYYVRDSFESTDTYNITQQYLEVAIKWEPNSTITGDEFYIESFTGLHTVNWSYSWADNYYWYDADTGDLVTPSEWDTINSTIFDEEGIPRPGYWDISWMAENFTSGDLKQQAIEEGWDWAIEDSQTWSWVWWELWEHYGTEIQNGTDTDYVSVDVWYEYAGMFAWNDTDTNNQMDYDVNSIDNSEMTHYWLPFGVDAVNFITPNGSASGDDYWAVNATVPFGVSFVNVSGVVFPFGEQSYWDWYQGQYYGSNFATFDERPTEAEVDEFEIAVAFTGTINETGNNYGAVKFNLTVGDWDIDAPGGRNVLAGRSLGVAFYSHVAMRSEDGTPLVTQYYDDFGQQLANNETAQSQNYTVSAGSSGEVASMNLGGEQYVWSKNKSASPMVDSQTVPFGVFQAAYTSGSGASATSFTVLAAHFYTLINFKWWGGYEVSVDPVFVSYSSTQGVADDSDPVIDNADSEVRFVDNNERLYFEVTALDNGSGVQGVHIMDTDTKDNYSLSYSGDTGKWVGYVEMDGVDPYTFNYTVVAVDYALNEGNSGAQEHTFWNDPVKPELSNIATSANDAAQSSIKISATVTDSGGSEIDRVDLYLVNSEQTLTMTYNGTSGKYEANVPRSSNFEYELAYRVKAYDNAGNLKQSSVLYYQFNDAAVPVIDSITSISTTDENGNETALIRATVTDSGGSLLSTVELTYTILGIPTTVSMTKNTDSGKWEYTIPNQTPGTVVFYTITATDGQGNSVTSSEKTYTFESEEDVAPQIGLASRNPEAVTSTDAVTISVTVTDDNGIENVTLFYKVDDGDWSNVSMTADGSTYSADIPAQAKDSNVTYYILAYDSIGQSSQTPEYYYIVGGDVTAPSISSVSIDITSPTSSDAVTVSATVTDDVALENVTLYYKVDDGEWIQVSMTADGDTYSGTIPAQADGSVVTYYIEAYDTSGLSTQSTQQSYTVEDESTTTTTTTTTTSPTTTTTPTPPPMDSTLILIIGAGVGVAVIVLIVVFLKKRN